MSNIKRRERGTPSKKMKRAARVLAVRLSLYEKGVKSDNLNGGRGFTKPGTMQMG